MRYLRIIPKLEIKGASVVKGMQMEGLRVVGEPDEMAGRYVADGADEILFTDIVSSLYGRPQIGKLIGAVSSGISIPLAVGGGFRSIGDIRQAFLDGADKVILNTALHENPMLAGELASLYGAQSIACSIQSKKITRGHWEAYTLNGREKTGRNALDWAREIQEQGVGEIYLSSIDQDGTARGPDFELVQAVTECVSIPVVYSGGISSSHDIAVLAGNGVSGVCIGRILHFSVARLNTLKMELADLGVPVRSVENSIQARG